MFHHFKNWDFQFHYIKSIYLTINIEVIRLIGIISWCYDKVRFIGIIICLILLSCDISEKCINITLCHKKKIHLSGFSFLLCTFICIEIFARIKTFIAPYYQNNKYRSLEATFICALTLGCNQLSVSSAWLRPFIYDGRMCVYIFLADH